MASKRQPSKHKRAAQNRQQRAARAARTANATTAASTARATGGSDGTRGGGSLLSRFRTGSTGSRPAPGTGSLRARGAALRPEQPPGYRAALSAMLAAAAAVLLCVTYLRYPVDAQGDLFTPATRTADFAASALRAVDADPDLDDAEVVDRIEDWTPEERSETAAKALWPWSVTVVLPVLGAGLGFQAVRKRSSSRVLTRAMYATLFGAVLTQALIILFIPVVLAMGVAMYQVRKAEAMAAAQGEGGEVIDVEEIDEDDDDVELDEPEPDDVELEPDADERDR